MTPSDLRKRREALSLTMEAIAIAIGVPKGTYANWEHGRANPSRAAQQKLEDCLYSLEHAGVVKLRIPLDPEVRQNLEAKAKKQGITVEELAAKILSLSAAIAIATVSAHVHGESARKIPAINPISAILSK